MPGKQQEDQPAREVTMNSPQQLLPCRECGAACEVVPLKGPHIQGECFLWACSQNQRLGGNCPDENVYLTEKAWNTRTTPPSDEQEVERVALKLAEAHDAIQNPRKSYAVISYRAGASVDYWNAQARAALSATTAADTTKDRGTIMLEMAAATREQEMWERRFKVLYDTHPVWRSADTDGSWGLRDFLRYAGEICGFALLETQEGRK